MTQKQRNTALTAREAQDRLQEYGLRLIDESKYVNVTTLTEVEVECAANHSMTRMYGNLRKRGCPDCNSPFGERLLKAFLKHYALGPDDWRAKAVLGLDPNNPVRKLFFDVASEARKIAIENHSDYHKSDKSVALFEKNISKEERLRLDSLKEAKHSGGTHLGGPMNGWKVGVVWFEAVRVAGLAKGTGTYMPDVVREFKTLAKSIGLKLRTDGIEIDSKAIYRELGRAELSGLNKDFTLVGPWFGRTREHRWRHVCGGAYSATILELETAANPRTGCPFCDREGNCGAWLDFLDRLSSLSYEYSGSNRFEVRTERQTVELSCSRHPHAIVKKFTRSKLYQWINSLKSCSKVSMLPPCSECAAIHTKEVSLREQTRIKEERLKIDARLKVFGFQMKTWQPSSVRNLITKKVSAQKNSIQCLKCKHVWETLVVQELAKAERRGKMGCPNCGPLKKGPKPKIVSL